MLFRNPRHAFPEPATSQAVRSEFIRPVQTEFKPDKLSFWPDTLSSQWWFVCVLLHFCIERVQKWPDTLSFKHLAGYPQIPSRINSGANWVYTACGFWPDKLSSGRINSVLAGYTQFWPDKLHLSLFGLEFWAGRINSVRFFWILYMFSQIFNFCFGICFFYKFQRFSLIFIDFRTFSLRCIDFDDTIRWNSHGIL